MGTYLSRRRFLQGASVLGAVAALGACSNGTGERAAAGGSRTAPRSSSAGTLVIVTLVGGNDALNTVVPVGDSTYQQLRGTLAVPATDALALSEGFALHPALVNTKALWDDDRLAVVHGVGFDDLDRSHFHCMDVWQAGSTDDLSSGWVGRWLDAAGTDPLDAVAVGRNLPLLARGRERSAAAIPTGPFDLPGSDTLHGLVAGLDGGDGAQDLAPLGALVARSNADLFAIADTVAPLLDDAPSADELGDDSLAARLDTVAAFINAGLPTKVYAVDLGGFDTHANQQPTHDGLLADLDSAIGTFFGQVDASQVTMLVYSEFGRRVAPNGSAGTDHGRAGTVLLAGAVQPGHHGDPPPLDQLDDGDLATTVDFRSVYGALLEGILETPAADILGSGAPAPLRLT